MLKLPFFKRFSPMPRKSAEQRSGSVWRAGAKHPKPPAHLSPVARKVWREVVECRPADFFRPGALHLLETFCEGVATQREHFASLRQVRADAAANDEETDRRVLSLRDEAAVKRVKDFGLMLATVASKLRISVQAEVDRKSRQTDEREPEVAARTRLLGGDEAWRPASGARRGQRMN